MQQTHYISPEPLTLSALLPVIIGETQLALSPACAQRIRQCRTYLEAQLAESDALFYGINTGFGALCDVRISKTAIEQLQLNLIQSHACGMGEEVPPELVRLMLFLKIQSLSYGYSGVRLELVERLIEYFNRGIWPVVYQLGSLGASGDLAPLAHLGLPLIGLGEVWYYGRKRATGELLGELNLPPLRFQSKEALALLNGTQFSAAYAVWCLLEALRLYDLANLCAALALDAFDCQESPFDERIHQLRPHPGQVQAAAAIRWLRAGSALAVRPKIHVQDPYAFRCVPQVHGASYNAFAHVEQVVLTEINAVTDNPNIFPDTDAILSGGNFHAQPLALVLDYLAIALSELGSISERRTYQLLSGVRGLPPFLTQHPGMHSGLMIAQYTAASMVSQNKQLCTPASVDSIVSSNGQEDHVSMAANAATKCYRVVQNVERLLAIEWMTAAQALEFRRPLQSSVFVEKIVTNYRNYVPKLEQDRILSTDMESTVQFLRQIDAVPAM
ncbi:MAG TPA: histidine ammonia-lyase [Saprospiraceae bacterium]|nr:histidine ammonia-lyase [Saprospiraceae bacterium]HMP25708.1 histidine ammonia-lyase [Saprospiraceae bacterium]